MIKRKREVLKLPVSGSFHFQDGKINMEDETKQCDTSSDKKTISAAKVLVNEKQSKTKGDTTTTSAAGKVVVVDKRRKRSRRRCREDGCGNLAVRGGSPGLCRRHGGGRRCRHGGCGRSSQGNTTFCKAHGGGRRCRHEGGCSRSARGNTEYCMNHGGGKRCQFPGGCDHGARSNGGYCRKHEKLLFSKNQAEGETAEQQQDDNIKALREASVRNQQTSSSK
jgi:hypothetical protein